jgi:acetyl-CoA acetyltransferase
MLRTPMTMDDYLNARMIADPLRLYDCVLPCAGAEAVVVAALDRVPKEKRVRVLATREQHNHPPGEVAPLHIGAQLFRDRLYADAGVGPADMQFVQAYDDYPVMVAIQLEDLGYFTAGEAPSFLAKHSFAWNGSFPLNTGGGQLSCGQTGAGGGMIGLWEAVAQLRHEAGARQIKGVKRGLVSGYGMVGYGHGLGSAAIILERAA